MTIGFSFSSPELASGETIESATATRTPIEVGGLDIDSVATTASEASVAISSGVDGNEYQINIVAVTTDGNILVGNILVRIIY